VTFNKTPRSGRDSLSHSLAQFSFLFSLEYREDTVVRWAINEMIANSRRLPMLINFHSSNRRWPANKIEFRRDAPREWQAFRRKATSLFVARMQYSRIHEDIECPRERERGRRWSVAAWPKNLPRFSAASSCSQDLRWTPLSGPGSPFPFPLFSAWDTRSLRPGCCQVAGRRRSCDSKNLTRGIKKSHSELSGRWRAAAVLGRGPDTSMLVKCVASNLTLLSSYSSFSVSPATRASRSRRKCCPAVAQSRLRSSRRRLFVGFMIDVENRGSRSRLPARTLRFACERKRKKEEENIARALREVSLSSVSATARHTRVSDYSKDRVPRGSASHDPPTLLSLSLSIILHRSLSRTHISVMRGRAGGRTSLSPFGRSTSVYSTRTTMRPTLHFRPDEESTESLCARQ